MAISEDKLAAIIKRQSAGLCSAKGDRILDEYAGRTQVNIPQGGGYVDIPKPDYNYEDAWGDGDSSTPVNETRATGRRNINNYTDEQVKKSGLPEAIKQSLINEKIEIKDNNSVLDRLGIDSEKAKRQRELMQERNERSQVYPTSNGGNVIVDYAMIKSIVRDCISEYFENEKDTALKTIKLSAGVIKIVDNSGNIYVAKLEKKGNVNDKK